MKGPIWHYDGLAGPKADSYLLYVIAAKAAEMIKAN